MSRLTRKDMKRDEVREGVGQALDYARSHGRQVVVGLMALVVLAAALGGWFAYRNQRSRVANDQLARAIRLFQAEIDPVAPQPLAETAPTFADEAAREAAARDAFERVSERYGGTRVARVASAYLAQIASRSGDLATATSLWQEAAGGRESALTAQIELNRLAVARAEGRTEEALAELEAMLDEGTGVLPQVVVLDQTAMTLEMLGREDEAREIYQRILDEYPQSAYSQRARERVSPG